MSNEQFLVNQIKHKNFKILSNANLPTRYWNANLDDFKIVGNDKQEKKINEMSFNKVKDYIANLEDNIEKGKGLYIWGPTRVGKSLIASIIMKEIAKLLFKQNKQIKSEYGDDYLREHRNTFYFIQATTLYRYYFRNTCSEKELSSSQILAFHRALCIDDIGKLEYAPGDLKVFMFDDVIRYRQLNGLTTLYTANTALETMKNILNESIHEIIKETCEEIIFVGEPFFS